MVRAKEISRHLTGSAEGRINIPGFWTAADEERWVETQLKNWDAQIKEHLFNISERRALSKAAAAESPAAFFTPDIQDQFVSGALEKAEERLAKYAGQDRDEQITRVGQRLYDRMKAKWQSEMATGLFYAKEKLPGVWHERIAGGLEMPEHSMYPAAQTGTPREYTEEELTYPRRQTVDPLREAVAQQAREGPWSKEVQPHTPVPTMTEEQLRARAIHKAESDPIRALQMEAGDIPMSDAAVAYMKEIQEVGEYGPPPKGDPTFGSQTSFSGHLISAVGALGRAKAGFTRGVIRAMQEQTTRPPISVEEYQARLAEVEKEREAGGLPDYRTGYEKYKEAEGRTAGSWEPGSIPSGALPPETVEARAVVSDWERDRSRGFLGFQAPPVELPGGARLGGRKMTRIAGLPAHTVHEAGAFFSAKPWQQAWDAFTGSDFDPVQLADVLHETSNWYADEAGRLAEKMASPDATDEELQEEAQIIYDVLMLTDEYGPDLRKPELAELRERIVGDLAQGVAVRGVGLGLKAGAKVAGASVRAAEGTRALGPAVRGTRAAGRAVAGSAPVQGAARAYEAAAEFGADVFSWQGKVGRRLQKLKGEVGERLYAAWGAAKDKGAVASRESLEIWEEAARAIRPPKKYPFGGAKGWRRDLKRALEGDINVDEIHNPVAREQLRKGVEKTRAAYDSLHQAGSEARIFSRVGAEGKLETAPYLKQYAPVRQIRKDVEKGVDWESKRGRMARERAIASAHKRGRKPEKLHEDAFIQDMEELNALYFSEAGRAAARNTTIQDMTKALVEESGLVGYHGPGGVVFAFGGKARKMGDTAADLKKAMATIQKETGVELGLLSRSASRGIASLTAKEGANLSDVQMVWPKAFIDDLERFFPDKKGVVSQQAATFDMLLSGWEKFQDYFLTPTLRLAKTSILLNSGWQFMLTNMQGNLFLDVAARGVKAFDPKTLQQGGRLALHGMLKGDPKALKEVVKLADGSEKSLGWILEQMQAHGMIRQVGQHFDLAQPAKGLYGKAVNKLVQNKVVGGWFNLAGATDELRRTSTFLTVLKGSSPADIRRAVQATSELAGHLSRLTAVERNLIQHAVPFYAWNRYYVPFVMKQMAKNPQRFSIPEDIKQYVEKQHTGGRYPVSHMGIQPHHKAARAITAFREHQPRPGEAPPGVFNVQRPELATTGLSSLLSTQYSKFSDALLIALLGYNEKKGPGPADKLFGKETALPRDVTSEESWKESYFGDVALNYIPGIEPILRGYELLHKEGNPEAASEWLTRCALARFLGPAEKLGMEVIPRLLQSVGYDIEPMRAVGSGGSVAILPNVPETAYQQNRRRTERKKREIVESWEKGRKRRLD